MVLSHLKGKNSDHLNFQLKIPVDCDEYSLDCFNVLDWIQKSYLSHKRNNSVLLSKADKWAELLREFGADESSVYGFKELESQPYYRGTQLYNPGELLASKFRGELERLDAAHTRKLDEEWKESLRNRPY